tara:strand:+ start:606 stop:4739 length:4134 start_codon:yes stop_codon:yes gene_type:complete
MPLDKRSFLGGMNKDGDVRLIKNPDYIDALNVRAATSVDGTVGSLENIEGNEVVPFDFYSTESETLFVNDNGLYEEINPATVFYQKVIRIQGWEQNNSEYRFTLLSVGPNGNIPIGEFNWSGNINHTFTAQYLYSQFSSVGPYNSGINVYDVNTGDQYTASIKLLTFGQNAMLHGGYFDVVVECDVAGVNFNLGVSVSLNSTGGERYSPPGLPDIQYTYTFSEDSSIPITPSENVSIMLLPSFDTGGVYNSDANDDGVVISPNGTFYEVGNRTVWRITFVAGEEPTSPAGFPIVNVFSYRENLNPADENNEYEFEPFLTIDPSTFSSGEFEFDSNQNKLSAFLHEEFSQSKTILCDGLPLDFLVNSDNFFLTFSENATFNGENNFTVIVVGPVGVKFKLALGFSYHSINNILSQAEGFDVGESDVLTVFGNGTMMTLDSYQIVENSIEITDSIINDFATLQEELAHQIQIYGEQEQTLIELNITNNNLETDLNNQIALTALANAELFSTESSLEIANSVISDHVSTINEMAQSLDFYQEQNDAMLIDIANLEADLDDVNDQLNQIQSQLSIALDNLEAEEDLTASQVITIAELNADLIEAADAIAAINVAHGSDLAALEAELGAEITLLQNAKDNLEFLLEEANQTIAQYIQDLQDQDDDHAAEVAQLTLDHQHEVAVLIAEHQQALDDAEDADQDAQDALQAQFDQDLADLTAQHNAEVQALEGDITSLTTQVSDQGTTIANLQTNIYELGQQIEGLQEQVNSNVISDSIIVSILDNYNQIYFETTRSYNLSLEAYNALNIDNQVIYEEDFSTTSDYENEWNFYDNVYFSAVGNIISLPSFLFEQNGYLQAVSGTGTYGAFRLPYSSFQNSAAWVHGAEITLSITFEVVSTSGSTPIPANKSVQITNQWDTTGDYDLSEEVVIDESYNLTPGGLNNPDPFLHTFTVVNNTVGFQGNYLDKYANIVIVFPPIPNQNIQYRITDIRMGNDSQEMFAFNLNNLVPGRRDFYLERYNEANDTILDWQNSGLDTLSEFIDEEIVYNNFLSKVIPGFLDDPNLSSNYTLGGRLQRYVEAVTDFSNAVTTQLYNQYNLYVLASNADISALEAMQQSHQVTVSTLEGNIAAQELYIEELQFQYDNAIFTIENMVNFNPDNNVALKSIITEENIVSSAYMIKGPEPGSSDFPNGIDFYGAQNYSEGISINPSWTINGETVGGDKVTLVSQQEYIDLCTQPISPTNNICYYITNRFNNNQPIEFEIPGGGYPTQVMHIMFLNFDENTQELNSSVTPVTNIGIDITNAFFLQEGVESIDDAFEVPMIQMLIYFNEDEADNVTFSDELYISKFEDGVNGTILWYGNYNGQPYHIAKPYIQLINSASVF